MDKIILLHNELKTKTYRHGNYASFKINDFKPRDIHKAGVRDRLLHHAIYRILYPYFDRQFIFDSYSCRLNKGTHKAVNRLGDFAMIVSKNHTRTVWILKGDIKKFFATIDHQILKNILTKYIADQDILWLLGQTVDSFNTQGKIGIGLPLGNLTSQLLTNIYMNEFDQFVKRTLKMQHYIRYADDMVFLHERRDILEQIISKLLKFVETRLHIHLHPKKVSI